MANAVHDTCRAELESERADLQQSIDELTGDDTGEGAAEAAALADTLRDTLRDVEDALGKLASGTYGTCELCKGAIGDERLREMPAARHCYDCADAQATVITSDRDVE